MARVSVIIGTHNHGKYVAEAIGSILTQTYEDLELIVVDDGSTDDTPEVLGRLEGSDPRLTILSPGKVGRTEALELAVDRSSAEYIAILDSDDVSLPHRLERQVAFLDANPEVVLVSVSQRDIINDKGEVVDSGGGTELDHEQIVEAMIRRGNPLFHSACLYRRSLYDAIGGYDRRIFAVDDYDFYVRAAAVGRLANLDEVLVLKRLHVDQFYFSGKKNHLKEYKRLRSLAIVNFNKVRYLAAPRTYYWAAFKIWVKAQISWVRYRLTGEAG